MFGYSYSTLILLTLSCSTLKYFVVVVVLFLLHVWMDLIQVTDK